MRKLCMAETFAFLLLLCSFFGMRFLILLVFTVGRSSFSTGARDALPSKEVNYRGERGVENSPLYIKLEKPKGFYNRLVRIDSFVVQYISQQHCLLQGQAPGC